MAETRVPAKQIDWSSFSLNMKSASNSTANTPTNNADTNLASNGATISFTVETDCYALVIVHVAVNSTTDYELKPQIWRDGVLYAVAGYPASINGSAGNRAVMRSHTVGVPLTAGAHTLSAGVIVSSATSQSVGIGAANITALVLGNVTA